MALHGVVTAARALRHDIAGGHVRPLEEIVHAEVFEDFLDMAAELLQGGYASSAAVLAGSVFEEHVRQLAAASGIAPASAGRPVAFDRLATNLTKLTTILETERKAVVAWYGLGPPARMAATPRSLLTTSSG